MKKEREIEVEKNIRRCKEDVIFDTIIFIILTALLLIVEYPLWGVIISSISDPKAVSGGEVVWHPVGLTFRGYLEVFEDKLIVRSFLNSVLYTVCGVLVNLAVTLPTAYALSRDRFSGKKIVTIFYVITMFFGGGLIPTYLVVQKCQLLDTMWALILPGSLSVYNMIVARTFFKSNISEELYEAAEIDGCTQGRFFFQIALPLSGAITAIMVLYYAVGHWNSFFNGLIYVTDNKLYPLQLILRDILITGQSVDPTTLDPDSLELMRQIARTIKYGVIIVSSLPVLILYPFVQKYFVKGVMIGSVKG